MVVRASVSVVVVMCIVFVCIVRLPSTRQISAAPRVAAVIPTATRNPDAYKNTVGNGGFELSGRVWKVTLPAKYTTYETAVLPERGVRMMKLSGTSNVSQTFVVPTTAPYLHYSYQLRGGTGACTDINYFNVLVSVVGEFATKSEQFPLCAAKNSTKWIVRSMDLSSMKGKKVTVHFRSDTKTGWIVIDDVGFVSAPGRQVDYY